jgi:hypothetical protein
MACSCDDTYTVTLFDLTCNEIACAYFQAVDEFGCSAYKNGQKNSCLCPEDEDKGKKQKKDLEEVPSKFGPVNPVMRGSTIVCNTPFQASCENYSRSLFRSKPNVSSGSGLCAMGMSLAALAL